MQKILTREQKCPWNISEVVRQIRQLMKGRQVQYQYIFRKDNKLANCFTNLALDKGAFMYTSFQQLETMGKSIVNSDKFNVHI